MHAYLCKFIQGYICTTRKHSNVTYYGVGIESANRVFIYTIKVLQVTTEGCHMTPYGETLHL